jgi:hypothetical protein
MYFCGTERLNKNVRKNNFELPCFAGKIIKIMSKMTGFGAKLLVIKAKNNELRHTKIALAAKAANSFQIVLNYLLLRDEVKNCQKNLGDSLTTKNRRFGKKYWFGGKTRS